jgi:hypothetical protein
MPHKVVKPSNRTLLSWADALTDAEKQLENVKRRARELAAVVRVCKQRVRSGEPFPGSTDDSGILGQAKG